MNLSEYLKSDYVKIKTRYRFPTQYMYGYKFEDREWFPKLNLMYISLIGTKELSVMFNNPSYTYTFTLAE